MSLAVLALAPAALAVTPVTCGDVLAVAGETYVLTADITDCVGTGLNITADDVTLDCECFTLSGSNDGSGFDFNIGVLVSGARATIKNCKIEVFHQAISSGNVDTTVDSVEVTNLHEVDPGVSEAIVSFSTGIVITNSYIHDTDNYAGVGLFISDGRVQNNVLERIHNCPGACTNAAGTPFGGYGVAIFGYPGTDNMILSNRFNDLDDAGVQIWGGNRLTIEGNVFENIVVPALPATGDAPASAAIYDRGGADMTVRDNSFQNISVRDGLLATNPPHGELIELATGGTVLIENNELDASATNNGVHYFNATDLSTVTVQNNNFTLGAGFDHLVSGVINGPLDVSGNWYGAAAAPGTTNDAVNITPTGPGQAASNPVNASAPGAGSVGLSPANCPQLFTGACCTDGPNLESECIEVSQDECDQAGPDGGLFLGAGTTCDDVDDCVALVVTMGSMSAVETVGGVTIRWTTESEVDTSAFRILRETAGGREKRLTVLPVVIPAHGSNLGGASYEFLDDAREAASAVVYYLEDVDIYGRTTRHGPIAVDRGRRLGSATGAER